MLGTYKETLFDSRSTVAWPPTTVAWPFSDFFQKISKSLETSKKRCLTVAWRSRDLRPLSRDRSVTFFKKISNCLKRTKTLFDSRPMVAWPPTTVAWPFSDFFQKNFKSLETSKNVVWQSADGGLTSDHCRVTVQRLFSKKFQNAWNVEKTLFDSQPTVAWPPTTAAWPFSNFFQIPPKCSKRRKNVVWQSANDRVNSHHCRVTVQRLFSKFHRIAWNVVKNVVWQSANGRETSDHCRVTVQRLFLKIFELLETSKKRCLTVIRRSHDLRALSPDHSMTFFFQNFSELVLEKSKKRFLTVIRRSRDLRSLSRDFFKNPFTDFLPRFLRTTSHTLAYVVFRVLLLLLSFRRTGQHSAYFDHVTPPSGKGQSWIFRHQMKDILREKRIFWFWWANSNSLISHEGNKFSFFNKDHVSPPSGVAQSWKFWYYFKANDGWKRIFDFGGKIPTRWFPMRETNSIL